MKLIGNIWEEEVESRTYSSNDISTEYKIKAELEQINKQISILQSRKRLLESGIYIEPTTTIKY